MRHVAVAPAAQPDAPRMSTSVGRPSEPHNASSYNEKVEKRMAAYGTSRSTAIELPRQSAVTPDLRTMSSPVCITAASENRLEGLTWYIIFTRSIGAVMSFETAPAAPPETNNEPTPSCGGSWTGRPETRCLKDLRQRAASSSPIA